MEDKRKFQLQLNLFDGIVLAVALIAAALLAWFVLRPEKQESPKNATETYYTIHLEKMLDGTASMVQVGDQLVDALGDTELGTVTSVEVIPSRSLVLDQQKRAFVLSAVEGYEDVLVTLKVPLNVSDRTITIGNGYVVRVGSMTYLRGAGFMARGPIVAIERREEGDQAS